MASPNRISLAHAEIIYLSARMNPGQADGFALSCGCKTKKMRKYAVVDRFDGVWRRRGRKMRGRIKVRTSLANVEIVYVGKRC